jgi:ligand-binding sensor domain-containing protein
MGVIRYNRIEQRWEEPLTGTAGLEEEEVTRVWVDRFDEKLYARTNLNLYEYENFFETWYLTEEVPSLDSDNRHVAAPTGIIPPQAFHSFEEHQLVDPLGRQFGIRDVVDDNSGDLWIGTQGYGSAKLGTTSKLLEFLPYGLLQNHCNAIYDDGQYLWISGEVRQSFRSGLTRFDPEENSFHYIEAEVHADLPSVDIYAIEGDDDYLYVGTEIGLLTLDRETERVTGQLNSRHGLSDDYVISLEKVGDSLFVGTGSGLTLVSYQADSLKHLYRGRFFNQTVYDLEQIGDYLWIGSSVGAYRLDLKQGRLQEFNDPELVLFSHVYDIEEADSNIWLVSDGGLVRLDLETGETESYLDSYRGRERRALAVNDRVAITASDNGMRVFFLRGKKSFSREFTTADGLASPTVNSLLMEGDYVWVGTDRGLTRFLWNNPDRVD